MTAISGRTLPTPLAFLDPDGLCWRMSQGTLLSEDQPLLQALCPTGIAFDGLLFELQMPGLLTNGKDYSSLPTPTARDYKDVGPNTNYKKIAKKGKLAGVIKTLPTPRAQNGEGRNMNIWARPLDQPQNLENALARLSGDSTS
tara:strand:+ start:3163 stop:3591 length:429 start_codon:yes stop_codon:yes gene_type:complete